MGTGEGGRARAGGLGLALAAALGLSAAALLGGRGDGPAQAPRRRPVATLVADLARDGERTRAYLELLEAGAEAVPALVAVAEEPAAPARREALELLGRIGDARALPAVLAAREPDLAETRLIALGRLRGPEALAEVRAALAGDDVDLRFRALAALASWPDPAGEHARDVLPVLDDPIPGLREFAARAVGARRLAEAGATLANLLERDDDAAVRQAAAWALLQLGDPASVAAVDRAVAAGRLELEGP